MAAPCPGATRWRCAGSTIEGGRAPASNAVWPRPKSRRYQGGRAGGAARTASSRLLPQRRQNLRAGSLPAAHVGHIRSPGLGARSSVRVGWAGRGRAPAVVAAEGCRDAGWAAAATGRLAGGAAAVGGRAAGCATGAGWAGGGACGTGAGGMVEVWGARLGGRAVEPAAPAFAALGTGSDAEARAAGGGPATGDGGMGGAGAGFDAGAAAVGTTLSPLHSR